jgi:DNA-binding NtrC family response regulator
MQALLLRFLESGEIWRIGADRVQARTDVRIVAATNRDLPERVAAREFRADLYYRLNVLNIRVPPLRERREDVPLLLDYFFDALAGHHQVPVPMLSAGARAALVAYDWPGNVRELRNVVERLVVRQQTGTVAPVDLPPEVLGAPAWVHTASSPVAEAAARSRADALYDRMVVEGQSFWAAVHPLFTSRDMTRDDMRAIVSRGLQQAGGSYRAVVQLFNMPPEDYRAFLTFLRKHHCQTRFATPEARSQRSAVESRR